MPRYVITGANSYIGKQLTIKLLNTGNEVTLLTSDEAASEFADFGNCHVVEGEISNLNKLREALDDAAGCFHLDTITNKAKANRENDRVLSVNVEGMKNVLAAISSYRLQGKLIPLVYLSSSAVYGDNVSVQLKEIDYPRPFTQFAADMLNCEHHARAAFYENQVPSVGLRVFNVYGPEKNDDVLGLNVVANFIEQIFKGEAITIYGDGEQLRDFVYIDDVVNAFIAALEVKSNNACVFNLCSGKGTTVNNLARSIMAIMNVKSPVNYASAAVGNIPQSVGDPNSFNDNIGIIVKTSIAEGLRKTINAFYKSQLQILPRDTDYHIESRNKHAYQTT